jgi:hypothetical protein
MSTRNLPVGKGRLGRKADAAAICELIVSQFYGSLEHVTGIPSPFYLFTSLQVNHDGALLKMELPQT